MKISLTILSLSIFILSAAAQKVITQNKNELFAGAETVLMQEGTTIPQLIKFRKGSEIDFRSLEKFIQSQIKSNTRFGLIELDIQTDQLGITHHRFQQTFDGLPIDGSMYLVHERNGKIEMMNGLLFDHINSSVPLISANEAREIAIASVPATVYRWQIEAEENLLRRQLNNQSATWLPKGELMYAASDGNLTSENFKLCFRFDIYSVEPLSRKYVYVDAATGNIVSIQDRIRMNDVIGTAVTGYSGTQSMTADNFNGSYRLRETGRGNGIETYNLQHATSTASAVDFTDADNVWNNVNANLDQYASDAHWGAEVVYDFYSSFFGRNSIDGNGFKLKSYVHYSTNFSNAYWDGSEMVYGDGNGLPFTTLDICGHEISHGLTQFTSNLVNSNESGALNESFSDCMGNAMEFWKKPSTASWLVFEELGVPSRSMSDPKAYGDPDTYLGSNWDFGGEVHRNSGVMNHWFYIVSVGETGINDINSSYSITGISLNKAQAILFRANTIYFTSSTNYNLARQYTIQAAADLYGACSNEVEVVTNSWYAVGVGAAYIPSVVASFSAMPTQFCIAPATVAFTNNSSNAGTFNWNFGDGTTSTISNPTHTYSTYGNYTVKLVSNGGSCGIDSLTLTNYISVNASNPCSVNMPQTGSGVTQNACSGILYDSGGPIANYQDNTNSTITISPLGASSVQLSFTSFNIEAGYDFLYIYDGPSTASPLLATLTGNYIPALIISTSPSVTIKQKSDAGANYSGFEIRWNCSNSNSNPVAAFKSDYTNTCTGVINFTDQSLNNPTSWLWNFGDGTTSVLKNPSHTYASSGTYSVSLTATNSIGSNTVTKTNFISVAKAIGPSTTGASVCNSGSMLLQASGNGTLNWYDAASAGNFLVSGSSYTTPVLNTTTNYYVESVTSFPQQSVGPANNSFGTSASYDNSFDRYLVFDVLVPVKLVSVKVYATGAATRTIELRNSSNATLLSKVISIADGQQVVTLNWDLPVGTSMRLAIGGPANLKHNSTGAVFPYTLSGVVSITGTNGNSGYYYYFYDWKLQQPTCISQRSTATATVNVTPATITPSGSTTICQGSSVTLNANTGAGLTYQWKLNGTAINGATTSSFSASAAGNYSVDVTLNSCVASSSTVTVSTIASPQVSISANGNTSFCKGINITMTATPSGLNYQWAKNGAAISGATLQSYTIGKSGNYTCNVTDACATITSNSITLTQLAAPSAATITPSGTVNLCSGSTQVLQANTGVDFIYQWKKGANNIAGATNSSLSVTAAGNYKVVVTNSTTACSKTSSGTKVTIITCRETESETNSEDVVFSVYPNPTTGNITLEFDNAISHNDNVTIMIKNIVGQVMQSVSLKPVDGINYYNLSLNQLSSGLYMIELKQGDASFFAKIILE